MKDRFSHWIARKLPKRITYWCAVVVAAHGTQGEYSGQIVPELTAMDAMRRYGADNSI